MTSVVEATPPPLLVSKAEHIEELARPHVAAQASASDDHAEAVARRRHWYRTLQDAVLDLSNVLPEGTEDYDARKLLEFLTALGRAIEDDPELLDATGDVHLLSLKSHDVALRIKRRLQHDALDDDPRAAFAYLRSALPKTTAAELGTLLGVSAKTIGAWTGGGAIERHAARVVLVAQLVTYLRPSMTPTGVVLWFKAARSQLGERTPLELLAADLASAFEPLTALARGSRAQLAG